MRCGGRVGPRIDPHVALAVPDVPVRTDAVRGPEKHKNDNYFFGISIKVDVAKKKFNKNVILKSRLSMSLEHVYYYQ